MKPEQHDRLQKKQVANIIKKVNAGKTLTAREQAILAAARDPGTPAAETVAVPAAGYATTWDELADACSLDRRTLTNVRERFAREIHDGEKEWLRADGRKLIAWWISFLADKGVRGRGKNNQDAGFIDERQLRLKREQVQLDLAEFNLAKAKEAMLPVADFEAALSVMLGNFRSTGNRLPGRAASKIVLRARAAVLLMLKASMTPKQLEKIESILTSAPIDYADVEQILQDEWDLVLKTLEKCEYLEGTDLTPPE